MSSAEADGWAWLLVLSFVFGCNVLRILLPSFSSFVSGPRGSPTGRGRAGFRPQKRLGWAVLGFKKELPGHPRPHFHVAASLRLGVLSGPRHPHSCPLFPGPCGHGAAPGCCGDSAWRGAASRVRRRPRPSSHGVAALPGPGDGSRCWSRPSGGWGEVADSVDRESQHCVLFPVSRGAAGPGERCACGAFCRGTSTLPPVPLSQLL